MGRKVNDNEVEFSGGMDEDGFTMKNILIAIFFAAPLISCGGGGGNPGTCEPASACQKSSEMPRPDAPGHLAPQH
jgi:hypothetical protein